MSGWGWEEAVLEAAEQAEPGRSRPGPAALHGAWLAAPFLPVSPEMSSVFTPGTRW